jgi:hypothetical protein
MAIEGLMMIKMRKSAGSSKKIQNKKDNGIPLVSTLKWSRQVAGFRPFRYISNTTPIPSNLMQKDTRDFLIINPQIPHGNRWRGVTIPLTQHFK